MQIGGFSRLSRIDPRYGQLAALGCLLCYTQIAGVFSVGLPQALAIFTAGLVCQYGFSRYRDIPFVSLSALITCCSLCLLLRTDSPVAAGTAAIVATSSKFLIRHRGRHVFNPTNLALALAPFISPAWISPGQWGSDAFIVAALAAAGAVVTGRAKRFDISALFFVGYVAALFLRAAYLGDPLDIPLRAVQNAGVALFAFFMLSDPATTPTSRPMRLLFGAAALAATLLLQFYFYVPAAFIYALLFVTILWESVNAIRLFFVESVRLQPDFFRR